MKKVIILTFAFSLIAIPVKAFTEPYPEVFQVSSNITCPQLYPVKTGSSSGGIYTTTCYSEKAWSLYMAGGDDWQAWINGTYIEPTIAPSPAPTVTVRPAPIVRNNTITVKETILEPCPAIETPKQIRKEIKRLQRRLELQKQKSSIEREIKRLQRKLNEANQYR
jgi:hypothetical protein